MSRLIDSDKLLKDFEKAKEGCKHLHELLFFDGVMAIVDNQPTVGGWIPCSERFPENKARVLITKTTGTVDIGHCNKNSNNEWRDSGGYKTDNVVAWQPLPEPYKEGKASE